MRIHSSVGFIFSPLLTHLIRFFLNIEKLVKSLQIIQKWGGGNVKDYVKQAIRNLLHDNSDVHSRRLIAEFPTDGIKCLQKLQSHCANMTFAEKVDMIELSSRLHIKEGNQPSIVLKGFRMHIYCQFHQETDILRTKLCTHFWITSIKVENTHPSQLATRHN